jgi:hypothetical protein
MELFMTLLENVNKSQTSAGRLSLKLGLYAEVQRPNILQRTQDRDDINVYAVVRRCVQS